MDSIDDNNNMTSPLLCKDDDEEVANSPVYNVTHPVVLLKEDDEETPTIATATTVEQRNNGKHKVNTNVKEKNGPRKAGDGSVLVVENTLEESTSLLPVETPTNWERGHVQPEKYRDWPYAIIFWIQFLSIAIYGIICFALFTPQQSNDSNTSNNNGGADILDDEVMLLYGSTLPLLLSLCFVFLLTGLLNSQRNIERLIFGSQCLIIASSILVTFTLLYQGLYLGCFLAAVSTVCGIWYLIVIQNRIPFAAANLNSGFHAVKSNKGVIMVGLLHWIVLAGWLVLWCTSLYHAVGMKQVCSSNDDESSCEIQVTRPGWIFPWVFSLFWTVQVIKYTVQTIVAGVSATWYFTPQEASSFCSSAVRSSIQRSLTTSFGSVCFGALLVAVIQFLDWLVKNLRMRRSAESREHGGGAVEALLLCCLDCILSLMEDIVQYFNKWAFIYVGVYGYPYLQAGKKVMTLFEQRGWTVVINDNLVSNALALMGFIIAVLTLSVSSIIIGTANTSFLVVGSLVAVTFISVFISVIESAVNTVIVCFAEAPAELGRNHLTHDREMRESWQKVYPTLGFY